eukprot:7351289-Prymnesium_polylepis.1
MGHDGSITAMLLADTRLLTWGTDAMLRVWQVFPPAGVASGSSTGPAAWEVDGGAQHPSIEVARLLGEELEDEDIFEWESDGETDGSSFAGSEASEEQEESDGDDGEEQEGSDGDDGEEQGEPDDEDGEEQ